MIFFKYDKPDLITITIFFITITSTPNGMVEILPRQIYLNRFCDMQFVAFLKL